MRIFRNSGVKIFLLGCGLLTAAAAAAGFFWSGWQAGVLTLLLGLLFCGLYLLDAGIRYRKMARLAGKIDVVLHGEDRLDFADYREGEFSLLTCELQKMTVALRSRDEQLKKDKVRMADFIADISHQIRTPLTSMGLLVSALGETEAAASADGERLRELKRMITRVEWLVSSLLKIARFDAGVVKFERNEVPFSLLLKNAAATVAIPMELRAQELQAEVQGGFCGDLRWTAEAIENILKNCCEHTPPGGSIYVTASENQLFSEITIRDTGNGFSPEDLGNVFERFYKGRNSSEQSIGIGLALSRMIITGQNGTVKAENAREGGALFTVRFYKEAPGGQ